VYCHPRREEYSGFFVKGMIEWGHKSKPSKIARTSNKIAKKIPGPKFTPKKSPSHKNVQKELNDITRKQEPIK